MLKKHLIIPVGLPITVLLAGVAVWSTVGLSSTPPDLVTATVTVGDVERTVLATGKLRPKELVHVGAQVSGQVKHLHVSLGQGVRAGDPIAEIDDEPQRLALQNAEAGVASLMAQRAARQAALTQAELAFQRQRTMLAANATARADYEAARATLETTRREGDSLDAQIVQARTQVDTARTNLGYTRIVAPMDGVVVAVVTKQGQTVAASQSAPTIVVLAKLDVMTVRAAISEADVLDVHPGQTVWFTTLGAPDDRQYARIESVDPAPEAIATEGTGSTSGASQQGGSATTTAVYYPAQFDVPNPDGRLRPSMTVQVSVLLASEKQAVIVPVAAITDRKPDGRATVLVLDAEGQPVIRAIRVGLSDETNAVVLSGLRPDEEVVLAEASTEPPVEAEGLF
ncbi:MAG: efflux RND transporter periplasmic adaptor subunit [Caulobacter sp.]|nr:efflux RND transporter periplasmic adaptor subunit [Rhodospirillum sp.]MCF8491444.1 efflux RND transporter periplasmic adaptor subunit [Rhodospirillum sp.]MCF8506937.1 efflux RND transporter periplasmic adaptor subunit [Caulobacter sp.]